MNLYHVELGLPPGFALPGDRVNLRWTNHAEHARTSDRYGVIPKVSTLPLSVFSVIEVGMEGRRVAKVVVRGSLNKTQDAIFVLIPGSEWTVKTVWINEKNDQHKTLDRSRYVC